MKYAAQISSQPLYQQSQRSYATVLSALDEALAIAD
jgi:hypothetical protein